MISILHNIWMLGSVILIFLILIHNPKSQGSSSENFTFSGMRTAEGNLNKLTWVFVTIFFAISVTLSLIN